MLFDFLKRRKKTTVQHERDVASLSRAIVKKIQRVVDGKDGLNTDMDECARAYGALALSDDFGVIAVLRPDGTFWEIESGSATPFVPLNNENKIAVMVYGAERYSWLKELLPHRPPSAIDCSLCKGTRRIGPETLKGLSGEIFCIHCDGLGWLVDSAR
jgi:hypothetical protein